MRHSLPTTCAAYLPDRFLIVMEAKTPLLGFSEPGGAEPVLNDDHTHVFMHEYWHYLHNISTLAGVMSLLRTLELTAIFTKTVCRRADGTSEGSALLNSEDQGDLRALVEMEKWCEGDVGPAHDECNVTPATIVAVDSNVDTVTYNGCQAPLKSSRVAVRFDLDDDRSATCHFRLGNRAIEESVAYLVETAVACDTDAGTVEPGVSRQARQFPYGVVSALHDYYLPKDSSGSETALALGTLALLTPAPGYALPHFYSQYADLRKKGIAAAACLKSVIAANRPQCDAALQIAMRDLSEHAKAFQGRGSVERAVEWLTRRCSGLVQLRKSDPLFDIRRLHSARGALGAVRLTRDILPCDLLQRRDGAPDMVLRDRLACFGTEQCDSLGYSVSDHLRVLQAQHSYVLAHLNQFAATFSSSERLGGAKSSCPYYTCCDLDLRKTEGVVCRSAPWRHARGSTSCWYSSAVNASLGTVNQRPRESPQRRP